MWFFDKFSKICLFLSFYASNVCKSERVFYYVRDVSDTDWNNFQISHTNERRLIPNDYIAWALYSNTINETGLV